MLSIIFAFACMTRPHSYEQQLLFRGSRSFEPFKCLGKPRIEKSNRCLQ